MALQLRRGHTSSFGRVVVASFAVLAIIAQPFIATNLPAAFAAPGDVTTVKPGSLQGWSTTVATAGATATFATTDAPLGDGALELKTPNDANASVRFQKSVNVKLADISDISFRTKQVAANGNSAANAAIRLWLDNDGNGVPAQGYDQSIVYEPYYNGSVQAGTWQYWDVKGGKFWGAWNPAGGYDSNLSLDAIPGITPNTRVVAISVGLGSSNPGWDILVDDLRFNGEVYNFDPLTAPLAPTDLRRVGADGKVVPCGGTTYRQAYTPTWTKSTSSHVAYYEYNSFNKNGVPGIVERNIGNVDHFNTNGYVAPSDGTGFAFAVRAVNSGGLKSAWVTCGVTYESVPPTATIAYSPAGPGWIKNSVIVTLTASEAIKQSSLPGTWNKVSDTVYKKSYPVNTVQNVTLEDVAGNKGTATVAITWIDKNGPTYTITSPLAGDAVSTAATNKLIVRGSFDDVAGGSGANYITFQLVKDGVSRGIYTTHGAVADGVLAEFDTTGFEEGVYYVNVLGAADVVGNWGTTSSTQITIDNTAPVLEITDAVRNSDGTYTISGTTTDDTSGIVVSIDGVDLPVVASSNGDWAVSTDVLAEGTHTITARSTDAAGNTGVATPAPYTVTVPAAESTNPGNGNGGTTPGQGGNTTPDTTTDEPDDGITPEDRAAQNQPQLFTAPLVFNNDGQGVLGTETTADKKSQASTDTGDTKDVKGISDVRDTGKEDGTFSPLGFAWYWWLITLVVVVGLWWLIAAWRRRRDEE